MVPNTYRLQSPSTNITCIAGFCTQVALNCSPEDYVISGGFSQTTTPSDATTLVESKIHIFLSSNFTISNWF